MLSRWTVSDTSPTASFASIRASPRAAVTSSISPSRGAIRGAELFAISALYRSDAADLPLQLHDAVEQGLGRRRAARNVDVDRNDAVAAAHHRIGIMIIAAAIGAAAHRDDVARLRHLVVDPPQRRRHLVAERSGDDHHVRLAR